MRTINKNHYLDYQQRKTEDNKDLFSSYCSHTDVEATPCFELDLIGNTFENFGLMKELTDGNYLVPKANGIKK